MYFVAECEGKLVGHAFLGPYTLQSLRYVADFIDTLFLGLLPRKLKPFGDTYYCEQQDSIRTVAIVEKDDEILGYGSLLRKPNIPEINAICIDENYRIIKWIDDLAAQRSKKPKLRL